MCLYTMKKNPITTILLHQKYKKVETGQYYYPCTVRIDASHGSHTPASNQKKYHNVDKNVKSAANCTLNSAQTVCLSVPPPLYVKNKRSTYGHSNAPCNPEQG